jgi:hypothetical protein
VPPQIAVQRRRINRLLRGDTPRPRDVDLEYIAFADVAVDALDGFQVMLRRRLDDAREPQRLLLPPIRGRQADDATMRVVCFSWSRTIAVE